MSINDINNAATAMNALKARYEGFLDDADSQIAQRQAGYDALASNLKGLISSEMYFDCDFDPDDPNPTNVNGGTFNSLSSIFATAPAMSSIIIRLEAGKTYLIDYGPTTKTGQQVFFSGPSSSQNNPSTRPNLLLDSYENGSATSVHSVRLGLNSSVFFQSVRVTVGPLRNTANFHTGSAAFLPLYNGGNVIKFGGFYASFDGSDDGSAMFFTGTGNHAVCSLRDCIASGVTVFDIRSTSTAVAPKQTLTLINNAVHYRGGVVGQSLIST